MVEGRLFWEDTKNQKAISLGIKEFEDKYPEFGKKLKEIIDLHRSSRRAYIEFDMVSGKNLLEEFYVETIMNLGKEFTRSRAEKLYESLSQFWNVLGRKKPDEKYSILLPE